jgi:hypothetical protein
MKQPSWEEFCEWPTDKVAEIIRGEGPKVCVFPINGTRRWLMLEHPPASDEDFANVYLDTMVRRHLEIYRLFFDHGITFLLTPIFGPDVLQDRSEAYTDFAVDGIALLAQHPDFLAFYREYGVRVCCYGDYHRYLDATPYAYVADLFDEIEKRTADNDRYYLCFGVFAHDAIETVAELSVKYHQEHGQIPDKRTLVALYYGVNVPPVDFFIGFDKFAAFDMPLVATGNEDLYFTVAPSPYIDDFQLRTILYDHLYLRRQGETDYQELTWADWKAMREFYRSNRHSTQGVGAIHPQVGFWYPLPQVVVDLETGMDRK